MSRTPLIITGLLACTALAACDVPLKFAPDSSSSSQSSVAPAPSVPQDELVDRGDSPNAPVVAGSGITLNERLLPGGIVEIGERDAANTLLLFTNHSCAYCRDFHEGMMPLLIDEYVREGTLKLMIVPFDIARYNESAQTAGMLLCAASQGKGAAMNDLLFTQNVPQTTLMQQINAMGMDTTALQTCLGAQQTQDSRAAAASFARSLTVDVVPAYFINGTKYIGLPEEADMRGQIEEGMLE